MTISELIRQLAAIEAEHGDLLIQVCASGPGDEFLWGDLTDLEVEGETGILNLAHLPHYTEEEESSDK